MSTITQHLPRSPERTYPIIIEEDALEKIVEFVDGYDKCIILYDTNLDGTATMIANMLDKAPMIGVKPGEASKSLREVERITQEMLNTHMSRKSLLINVGGGVLTDLGGFIASIYMRGIDCINVSTSLLGMVDATVGGKTGVDVGTTKNILGSFYHPTAIIIDMDVLRTLPDQQLHEGLVEIIKMAAVLDAEVFKWIEENMDNILAREAGVLQECIEKAVQMKVDVVEADEKEGNKRMFLNFGHTIGHAVEALSNFELSHGAAVSIGMMAEMNLKESKTTDDAKERITALLKKNEMPTAMPDWVDEKEMWDIMKNDKKTMNGAVKVAVPVTIGEGCICTIKK